MTSKTKLERKARAKARRIAGIRMPSDQALQAAGLVEQRGPHRHRVTQLAREAEQAARVRS